MKYSVIILLIVLSRISFAQTSKGDEYYQQVVCNARPTVYSFIRTVRHICIAAHPTLKPKQCKRACLSYPQLPDKTVDWKAKRQNTWIQFRFVDKFQLGWKIDVRWQWIKKNSGLKFKKYVRRKFTTVDKIRARWQPRSFLLIKNKNRIYISFTPFYKQFTKMDTKEL